MSQSGKGETSPALGGTPSPPSGDRWVPGTCQGGDPRPRLGPSPRWHHTQGGGCGIGGFPLLRAVALDGPGVCLLLGPACAVEGTCWNRFLLESILASSQNWAPTAGFHPVSQRVRGLHRRKSKSVHLSLCVLYMNCTDGPRAQVPSAMHAMISQVGCARMRAAASEAWQVWHGKCYRCDTLGGGGNIFPARPAESF